jgi:hypothetical protein
LHHEAQNLSRRAPIASALVVKSVIQYLRALIVSTSYSDRQSPKLTGKQVSIHTNTQVADGFAKTRHSKALDILTLTSTLFVNESLIYALERLRYRDVRRKKEASIGSSSSRPKMGDVS